MIVCGSLMRHVYHPRIWNELDTEPFSVWRDAAVDALDPIMCGVL